MVPHRDSSSHKAGSLKPDVKSREQALSLKHPPWAQCSCPVERSGPKVIDMLRLFRRLQEARYASQDFVRVSSQVIEENKSLLWLVGTVSSALAGWCVYVLRRLHYERIEGAMSEISLKMKHMEQIAGEQEKEKVPRAISKIEMVTIIGPAVISAFSFGYLAGRSISSYKWHKQLRVTQGLNSNRVYVAVIPEHLFEAQKVASELEKAVSAAEAQTARKPWWRWPWQQKETKVPEGQSLRESKLQIPASSQSQANDKKHWILVKELKKRDNTDSTQCESSNSVSATDGTIDGRLMMLRRAVAVVMALAVLAVAAVAAGAGVVAVGVAVVMATAAGEEDGNDDDEEEEYSRRENRNELVADKAIPCGSKICTKRIKDREQQLHRERVRNMKSQVDTGMPTVAQLDHVKVNLKKEQMMEDRYTEIDRDNRILLKKMTDIMKQQTTFPPTGERKSGPSSLNKDARKKELIRITRENQCILKRIQQAQPVYNHVEWEDQHRRNVTYLKNRCEFPVVLRTPRRERYASSELVHLGEEEAGDMTSRSAPSTGRGPPKDVLQDFADGTNQKYVLKEGMKLSDNYYLVDMSTDGRNLFVSAYDNTTSNTLELVIKERLHRQLYRETNGDYRQIADRLKVSGDGKLLLDGEEAPGQVASEELDAAGMTRRSNNRQPHTAR
eukprot:s880_g2.t1